MTSAKTSRYPGLDLLRSIAILLVIMQHMPRTLFPEWFMQMKYTGWIGVDLFFVLSGYLIGSQLLRPYAEGEQPSFTVFYMRRALRVLPAYLVVVLLYFTVPVWAERPGLPPLWKFLTFTQNFGLDPFAAGTFSHAWSLCVEEHFYLVLPVIVFLLMRKPRFSTACVVASSIMVFETGLRFFLYQHYLKSNGSNDDLFSIHYWKLIYYPTFTRLDGLLMGVVIAAVKTFRAEWWKQQINSRGNVLLTAGLLVMSAAIWLCQPMYSPAAIFAGFPLLAIGFGLLVISALSDGSILARYRVPGAGMIATLAYSIYLTHKEIIHLDRYFFGKMINMDGAGGWILYPITILAAGTLLYLCVERPFLKLRERIISPKSSSALSIAAGTTTAQST